MFKAKDIIEKRKQLWEENKDIDTDKKFRQAVAEEIKDNEQLQGEIQNNPEKLIEMVFVIVNKDKVTMPFFLNEVQADFVNRLNRAIAEYEKGERLSLKFLVLKGRQQGFTSFITAYQLACTITRKNFEGFTAADEDGNSSTIFQNKAKFPYGLLPEILKPTEKFNNRKQFLFDVLNSSWEVKTASKNMGRSRTINFFHGSEAAFWKDNISDIQAGLGEALTKNAIQILESTANGYNEFKDLWDSGKWGNCFYQWWHTKEYSDKFENNDRVKWFKDKVKNGTEWIWERCRLLVQQKLTWEQIYWYYNKWNSYIDVNKIKQEYPCSADEAFLASGDSVFNKEIIIQHKMYLQEYYKNNPYIKGYFLFKWEDPDTKNKITDESIEFIEDENGYIRIYEQPQKGYPYVLGGDTKGEGSDFFAATVINNMTGYRCCTLHRDMDPDAYAHQLYCLGRYYNNALIGVEINFDIFPREELKRLKYNRQYKRIKLDKRQNERTEFLGWRTDGNTRPFIISKQKELLRDNIDLFTDIQLLNECLTFVYDDNGRPDAEEGKHDDILFSDMIANAIRTQQSMKIVEEEKAEYVEKGIYTRGELQLKGMKDSKINLLVKTGKIKLIGK